MKNTGRHQGWMVLGILCLFFILSYESYGASLTIGNTVSVNGDITATSFSGDGSGLTNVGGNSSCTAITSLPFTITAPGVYCLTSDLATNMTSGAAITINTDDVVLDLNGFKLSGIAAGIGTEANGIQATNRQNIIIRNGTVRGFFRGILLGENVFGATRNHVVEYIRADYNRWLGIVYFGTGGGVIIRNNRVVNTGGTTVWSDATGISIYGGNDTRVLNNDVIATAKRGTGISTGIHIDGSFGSFVVNNRISGGDIGIEFGDTAFGKYRDNLTYGVVTPFIGGTPVGIND